MNWYRVDVFSLSLNLAPLLRELTAQGVAHRVTEEPQGQCLWVDSRDHVASLQQWINSNDVSALLAAQAGNNSSEDTELFTAQSSQHYLSRKCNQLGGLLKRYPVSLLTLCLGIIGALLLEYDQQLTVVSMLTFQPVKAMGAQLALAPFSLGWEQGQYWRVITPIFLHFGIFHILFNGLWIWEFGRRVELGLGHGVLALLVIGIGVASNAAQYLWQGPSLFGGLSGVLYGLMGFLWIFTKIKPQPAMMLQPGIVGFMLVWMVLGMTGAVNFFIDGSIANAAHLGGLVAGMAFAPLAIKLLRI